MVDLSRAGVVRLLVPEGRVLGGESVVVVLLLEGLVVLVVVAAAASPPAFPSFAGPVD